MKKILVVMCLSLAVVFATTAAWSLTVYTAPIDSIVDYGYIDPPSDDNEIETVAGWLGMDVDALLLAYDYYKDESFSSMDFKDLTTGWDPGFSWAYALVKVDGPNDYSYLFMDDNATQLLSGGDDLLTTPEAGNMPYNMDQPPYAISHVSWFKANVPEPSALILLGLGLLGVATVRRLRG